MIDPSLSPSSVTRFLLFQFLGAGFSTTRSVCIHDDFPSSFFLSTPTIAVCSSLCIIDTCVLLEHVQFFSSICKMRRAHCAQIDIRNSTYDTRRHIHTHTLSCLFMLISFDLLLSVHTCDRYAYRTFLLSRSFAIQ